MLPIMPATKAIMVIKKIQLATISGAGSRNIKLIGMEIGTAPVSIRNFLSRPVSFILEAKTNNVIPRKMNKAKTMTGMKTPRVRDHFPTAGMKFTARIRKSTTNAQNTNQINFFISLPFFACNPTIGDSQVIILQVSPP